MYGGWSQIFVRLVGMMLISCHDEGERGGGGNGEGIHFGCVLFFLRVLQNVGGKCE